MNNLETIEYEAAWLYQIICAKIKTYLDIRKMPLNDELIMSLSIGYFQNDKNMSNQAYAQILLPLLPKFSNIYIKTIHTYQLQEGERLVLILALVPHLYPDLLSIFDLIEAKLNTNIGLFGGKQGKFYKGFLPTGQTAAFLLAENENESYSLITKIFSPESTLVKHNLVNLLSPKEDDPELSGMLQISAEYLHLLTQATPYIPKLSEKFPAEEITTPLTWEDLVLPAKVLGEIEKIKDWYLYEKLIMEDWGLATQLKKGYRAMFYGASGTGKTLTATLLGKFLDKKVFKVALNLISSKWVGETEKNLENLFNQAENRNWILFFDEAESLFSHRSASGGSNDKYNNQQVGYLLSRIENYNGLVILSTNQKGQIDAAFRRRFQSMVEFPLPTKEERLHLWQNIFKKVKLSEDINLAELAEYYEITGGMLINVLRVCAIEAAKRTEKVVLLADIMLELEKIYLREIKNWKDCPSWARVKSVS